MVPRVRSGHDSAPLHLSHIFAQAIKNGLLVAHDQAGYLGPPQHFSEAVHRTHLAVDIERGEWLIQQQYIGSGQQGTPKPHALLLAAREVSHVSAKQGANVEPVDDLVQTERPVAVVLTKGEVLRDIEVWKEMG